MILEAILHVSIMGFMVKSKSFVPKLGLSWKSKTNRYINATSSYAMFLWVFPTFVCFPWQLWKFCKGKRRDAGFGWNTLQKWECDFRVRLGLFKTIAVKTSVPLSWVSLCLESAELFDMLVNTGKLGVSCHSFIFPLPLFLSLLTHETFPVFFYRFQYCFRG